MECRERTTGFRGADRGNHAGAGSRGWAGCACAMVKDGDQDMMTLLIIVLNLGNLFGLLGGDRGQVGEIRLECLSGALVVECSVSDLDAEMLRRLLESGEIVEFTYQIEHQVQRRLWFDVNLGEYQIQKYLSYEPLARQYYARRLALDETTEERIFSDFGEAMNWLTGLQVRLPRPVGSEAAEREYLRLRVVQQKSRFLWLIPRETSTPWQRVAVDCP